MDLMVIEIYVMILKGNMSAKRIATNEYRYFWSHLASRFLRDHLVR